MRAGFSRFIYAAGLAGLLGITAVAAIAQARRHVGLPPPYATPSVARPAHVIGWPDGRTPVSPGRQVTLFASGLAQPRQMIQLPNGDILVAESRGGRITLFRGGQRQTFISGLDRPFGMLLLGNSFYVADTNALLRFPYTPGATHLSGGRHLLSLPGGGHWTRDLATDGRKIYISVGSDSNVGQRGQPYNPRRASIWQVNPDGSGMRIYASGLRNPVTIAFAPGTHTLWTVVNERDGLGDNLPPDYLTSVRPGGFYGWPYAYIGPHPDPRRGRERPDMVRRTISPDFLLPAHSAPLGMKFGHGGAYIAEHGSWNRSVLSGYKVVFVPFSGGHPAGGARDFLTGFIAGSGSVHGRPVGVLPLNDGSVLVSDDGAGRIWRVSR